MKRKIYSFNSELFKVTGVQKVLMDVHHALCEEYDAKIVGTIHYKEVHKDLGIKPEEYVQMKNPFMFRGSIVILHERKFLMMFWLLNHVLFQNIKLVYIHHNMLYGHKFMTRLPEHIVAISDEGIRNLTDYFGTPREHITKIYNCVVDVHPKPHPVPKGDKIRLLLPARINAQKRQLDIVDHLKEKLSHNVTIFFAGIGPDLENLKEKIKDDDRFVSLGFCSDIYNLLHDMDYMLLFSAHEGLPISLIEADMLGTPVITNDVGGNSEIVHDGENGFIINDWNALADCLNSLADISKDKYESMSKSGRKIYLEHFTYEAFKAKYLKLLSGLQYE